MKLLELRLQNWGPFEGEQVLDLTTAPEAPVVLVHGENMRGKTNLLRGIRWALYGRVTGHDGADIPVGDFANYDQRDTGQPFQFGTELDFEHRGTTYVLSRMMDGIGVPRLGGFALEATPRPAMMRIAGGNPVPERDIDELIQRILHVDISDFFLFDGEMLARFEERLRGDASSNFIRRQIEMALGVPALRLVRQDLHALLDDTRAAVRRAAKAETQNSRLAQELENVEDEIERHAEDLRALQGIEVDASALVAELDADLSKVDAIKELYYQRRAAVQAHEGYCRDRDGYRSEIKSKLDEVWWLPLAVDLQTMAVEAQSALDTASNEANKRVRLATELEFMREQMANPTCRTCGQPMPADATSRIEERAASLERLLGALETGRDAAALADRVRQLRPFLVSGAVADQLRGLQKDAQRMALRADMEASQIENFTQGIEGDEVDIFVLEKRLQDAKLEERQARESIRIVEEKHDAANAKRAQITRQLASASPSGAPRRAELQVLEELDACLEEAMDGFRENMRKQVQEEASRIFRSLTTEADFAGLRIDGNYYLNIVDNRDRVITRRSAGADQIVTMSLIGALARCSVEEGPIVMDTPFGRLDRGHRKRILQWVSALRSQAVLFVQSGEFERDRDLGALNGRVGREFSLRRVGASSTRIEVTQ